MTTILGFDPGDRAPPTQKQRAKLATRPKPLGPATSGWALIETRGGAGAPVTATYLASGNVESRPERIAELLRSEKPDIVALEDVRGYAYATKGPSVVAALVATARCSGGIGWLCWALGIAVEEMPATMWRRIVLGNGSADDKRIADVIPNLIHGWPKTSNKHTRDAGGCALGTAWKLNGKAPRALDGRPAMAQ